MLWLVGCNADELVVKNLEGPTLNTGVAVPIGSISYTLRDLIDDANINVDLQEDPETSLFYVVYRDTAEFDSGQEIVNILDVSNNDTINVAGTNIAVSTEVINLDTTLRMSYTAENGERLDRVYYNAGTATFSIVNNIADPGVSVTYVATIQGTKLASNDNPMVFTETGPGSQSLVGYYSEFVQSGDSNVFLVDLNIEITVQAGSNIPPGSEFAVNVLYANQQFSQLYGDFGQDTLNVGNETLGISFFDDFDNDAIIFGDPTLTFDFRNSFGIPLEVDFGGLYGLKTEFPNDTVFMSGPIVNLGPVIEAPGAIGETETSVITLNNKNSNLVNFLATAPNEIGFDFNTITNPRNLDIDVQDFVLDTSHITTYIELNLPLTVQLIDLVEEVGFGLDSGLNFPEVDSLVIRIITINELPFSGQMDLEIYDLNDNLAFIAPGHLAFEIPFLNTDGTLKQARKHIEDIPITRAGVEALKSGKKLNLKMTLNTPGSGIYVKMLADYTLDIKLSALGLISVDIK